MVLYLVDVQNRRAFRDSCYGVRNVEREASPTSLLAVPHCAYSHRW